MYDENVNTNFEDKEMSKENISWKCLSLVMLDSVKVKKKYYSQTLLEEFKHEIKETKMENLINDELEASSSDDESDNETNSENGNET